jgi:2',3'-cyclic-nucleotide 2'-phosphodiesterase (5'-nucleotidase family)
MKYQEVLFSISIFLASLPAAHAELLEIIHTNDLHSHFEHASDPTVGSYAAVKATIDRLKAEAQAQGIDTLVLDAGDFNEDSQFYFAKRGLNAWKMMNAMGYDAVEIGNHDWLMGGADLDRDVGLAQPNFKFLGANFPFSRDRHNLARTIRPYAEFDRSGVRIAVLGLTTSDLDYSWRTDAGVIESPEKVARDYLPGLRASNDFVFALTHIGVDADVSLAQHTRGLDLIVGGHSHTNLFEAVHQADEDGNDVPIVQAGQHGEHVGDLLVDVTPGLPLRILRYQLIPVAVDGPRDPEVVAKVADARRDYEDQFGADWLSEVVGHAAVPLARDLNAATPWSQFIVDAMKDDARADLAIDSPQFIGLPQPAGPINREQLMILCPRIFDFDRPYGWNLWTVKVRGWFLELALDEASRGGDFLNHSGFSYDTKIAGGKQSLRNFRFNGRKMSLLRQYTLSVPEGIVRAAFGITPLLKALLRNARDTGEPLLFAAENHLRKVGEIQPLGQ